MAKDIILPVSVVLKPGQSIAVSFQDTDGEIKVKFGNNSITVFSDMPDNTFHRSGIIYMEDFSKNDQT